MVSGVGLCMNVKDLYDDFGKGEINKKKLFAKTGTKMVGSILIGSAMVANPIFGGIACATYSHGVDKLFQPNLEVSYHIMQSYLPTPIYVQNLSCQLVWSILSTKTILNFICKLCFQTG